MMREKAPKQNHPALALDQLNWGISGYILPCCGQSSNGLALACDGKSTAAWEDRLQGYVYVIMLADGANIRVHTALDVRGSDADKKCTPSMVRHLLRQLPTT